MTQTCNEEEGTHFHLSKPHAQRHWSIKERGEQFCKVTVNLWWSGKMENKIGNRDQITKSKKNPTTEKNCI